MIEVIGNNNLIKLLCRYFVRLSKFYSISFDIFLSSISIQAAIMLVATILLRCYEFNNPTIEIDEEFYVLIGDKIIHGFIPYVDIWDRKPIGLFLIYAGIRLLGGNGIIQYQVVASLFAAGTAFIITRFASKMASPIGAVLAGLVYLVWIGSLGGEGGQSPVFYNLLTISAAMLTLRLLSQPTRSRHALAGALVMLVCGVDMQIKYTAVFECMFFGLSLLWSALSTGVKPLKLVGMASIWIGCALLPTIAAFLVYWHLGHAEAFWYANFESIWNRQAASQDIIFYRLFVIVLKISPLLIGSFVSNWPLLRARAHGCPNEIVARCFVLAWLVAAIIGFLMFGTYFDHYAIPLIVPLSLTCAPALEKLCTFSVRSPGYIRSALASVVFFVFGLFSLHLIHKYHQAVRDRNSVASLAKFITLNMKNCIFIYEGDPILYYFTKSCLPSRYVFPYHLNDQTERYAVGIDQASEVKRILSNKPNIIVVQDADLPNNQSTAETDRIVRDSLSRNYHMMISADLESGHTSVYERIADAVP